MFFNTIIAFKKVPDQWKSSITIPRFKTGAKNDTTIYFYKLFLLVKVHGYNKPPENQTDKRGSKTVNYQKVVKPETNEEQHGFKPFIIDAIFTQLQISHTR